MSLTPKRCLALAVFVSFTSLCVAQSSLTLHPGGAKTVISKNIYGHFAEHLGHCIYDGIYVGDSNRTIPNSDGIRNDIIAALVKLKVPVLRWPGGCFADTYHWKDGVGAKNKRPSMVNKWWGGVTEDNSFGTHDFLNLCEKIHAEPYLSGNVGSGTVQELVQWVQYVNTSTGNPMADWRKQNGRDSAWNVKYFGVGNEAWGCGGNMTADYYADIYRQYVTFLSGNGTPIFRIASGANSDDYNWTRTLMTEIPHDMLDGVALHYYSVIDWKKKSSASGFTLDEYFATMTQALRMEELVSRHSAIMDSTDPKKKIALVVDEWGGWYDVEPGTNPGFLYQQNTIRDAMIAGVTLNVFNNHSDRVRMANLAQIVNVLQAVILTNKEKIILTPTYHVMEMYNVHQNALLIPVNLDKNPDVTGKPGMPALSASASKDSAGNMHLSLVNIDPAKTNEVSVSLDAATVSKVSGRILSSQKLQDHNSFEKPDMVSPKAFSGATLKNNRLTVTLPPASVVVLTLR